MGKNPAFQFYPSDWSRDLEEHPLEIEGAWIRICCKLWWSETRGKLTRTAEQWAKILRVYPQDAERILSYIKSNKIGDVSPTSNGNLTVISRRMLRDEKGRENNCIRQKRYYDKRKPNAPLTPTSQHSSVLLSSSSINKSITDIKSSDIPSPPKEALIKKEPDTLLSDLKEIIEDIGSKITEPRKQREVMLFIESNIKTKNHTAMMCCIKSLQKQLQNGIKIEAPKQYLEAALKIEDGKHNARDYESRAGEFKKAPTKQGMAAIGQIMAGIGRAAL